MKTSSLLLVGLAILALAGCGSTPGKDYKYHSGQGKVEGAVPQGSTIEFSSTDDANFIARGPIKSDGTFTLTTYINKPSKKVTGLPEGTYKVHINSLSSTKQIGPPRLPETVTVKKDDPMITLTITGS